ncbi:MAG: DUF2813 domain-containing protein [Succinivibrionaceae bacterium]
MYLERIEITGYRGISRLSLNLNQQTVLIGENSWGKSSLLRSLWCILGNGNVPYEFEAEDFRKEDFDSRDKIYELSFVLTFREMIIGSALKNSKLRLLDPVWVRCKDSYHRVFYYIHASMNPNGTIFTTHTFLDANSNIIQSNLMQQVQNLLMLNPVFRLRDSRAQRKELEANSESESMEEYITQTENSEYNKKNYTKKSYLTILERRVFRLFKLYLRDDGETVTREDIKDGIKAVGEILEHYYTVLPPLTSKIKVRERNFYENNHRTVKDMVSRPVSNNLSVSLRNLLKNCVKSSTRLLLAIISGAIIETKLLHKIDRKAHPIVILEDIESRLHPTTLLNLWHIIELLPIQKIVTTNSGDLLSSVNIADIRRMSREVSSIKAMAVDEDKFSSDELRKISFHIRLNRSNALFARCWLFVEGETEIWIINEIAALVGINLYSEGIRLIEYAQCGVAPLVKLANQIGMAWHLLADGDDAGIKYAKIASANNQNDNVTLLPSVDIEHFFYEHGFEKVYKQNCGVNNTKGLNEKRIIELAVKKHTKPGMALSVADEARRLGRKSVPLLFQKMFARIVANATSRIM